MRKLKPLLLVLCFSAAGCSPAARQNAAQVIGAAAAGTAGGNSYQTAKLMIFGGLDHKAYLGCLNCSEYATDSVLNAYGENGSPYSVQSIWNHYSEFGSPYSPYGACNPYANDPPVIVDPSGNYYGRLSLNAYHPQLGIGSKYFNWLKQSVFGES